jgi:hypothetical protein
MVMHNDITNLETQKNKYMYMYPENIVL